MIVEGLHHRILCMDGHWLGGILFQEGRHLVKLHELMKEMGCYLRSCLWFDRFNFRGYLIHAHEVFDGMFVRN